MKDENDKPVKAVTIWRQNEKWFVTPGTVKVGQGEDVIFTTQGTQASILIPKGRLFETPAAGTGTVSGDVIILAVARDGQTKVTAKKGSGAKPLVAKPWIKCRYAVYCHQDEDFAEGSSSPIMLIEPPS